MKILPLLATFVALTQLCLAEVTNTSFELTLSSRTQDSENPGRLLHTHKHQSWKARETAIIVCDMWDAHHCLNATKRVGELAPRMNDVLKVARGKGATIVHAPSSCLDFYQDHPARKRTIATPKAASVPEGIDNWLNWLDEREESAGYPIDASDGGEDDEKEAHDQWAKELAAKGRNPKAPWIRQTEALEIDEDRDFITDNGTENWNVLDAQGIKNVILLGVHTNMCVLGRPFGLRQMAKNGKNVVLMRDMTDTMYNPKMPPFVNHFRGTDLIIDHVETYVCPTITSNQLLGGSPFQFESDERKHLVMLIGEKEYKTAETLPLFAAKHLSDTFRVSYITATTDDPNAFPNIEEIAEADVLLISVRRRALPETSLKVIRDFIASGKPVVGIRTASHAFSLRDKAPPAGHDVWEKFDPEVWGGSYRGHHGNKIATSAWRVSNHAILNGIPSGEFSTGGSLYEVLPLEKGAQVLLMGRAGDCQTPRTRCLDTSNVRRRSRLLHLPRSCERFRIRSVYEPALERHSLGRIKYHQLYQSQMNRRSFLTVAAGGLTLSHSASAAAPIVRPGSPTLRTSLAAYSFREQFKDPSKLDMFKFIDYCADHGLEGTELTSYFFPEDADDAYYVRIKRHAFLRGISVSGTAVGNNFAMPKGEALDKQIADVKQWIDRSHIMGAPHIRVFAGAPKGIDRATAVPLCVNALEECCEYAGKKGIFLGLENHGGIVAEAPELLEIVKAVKSPWLGINLDTGNFRTDDPYGDLAKCAPYAVNVQVKVEIAPRGQDKQHADLPRLIKILRDSNYQGFVALEYEAKEDPYKAVPGYLEKLKELCS